MHYLWEFLYIIFRVFGGLWSNVYIVLVPSFIDYIPGHIRVLLAFVIYRDLFRLDLNCDYILNVERLCFGYDRWQMSERNRKAYDKQQPR